MTVSKKRMKQVDKVRWRLLSTDDRLRLEQLAQVRNQKLSTVLRILRRRFDGNVQDYMIAEGLLIKLPPLRQQKDVSMGPGMVTSSDLAKFIKS